MLDNKIRILACVIVIIGFISLIRLIRARKLEIKYSLIWFAAGIVIIIFSIFPHLMKSFSHMIGIYSPTNMLFFFALIIMAAILMALNIVISGMSSKIRKLIQEVTMLKYEIEQMKKCDD